MRPNTRLLTRLFCRRFLDNDLVAPSGELEANAAVVFALLAVPGFFNLAWLLFTYSGPLMTPSERLLLALDHKYQFMACSMIVTALGASLEWDALSIDARDMAILGPLPVPAGAMWRAKILALVVFLDAFAIAVNLIPTIGFPVVWLSLLPIGFVRAGSVVGVHALTSLAAAIFGFCAIVALRSLLLVMCGPRLFRAVSTVVQFLLVLALVTALLLLPGYSSGMRSRLRTSTSVDLSPPMWFVGVYDRMTVRALYADPDMARDSTWRFWERERIVHMYSERRFPGLLPEAWIHPSPLFRTESEARQKYLALQPVLDRLAGRAAIGFPLVILAAIALYLLAYLRCGRRLHEALTVNLRLSSWPRRLMSSLAGRLVVPRQLERTTFFFTLQGLFRSSTHRLRVAALLAIGTALALGALTRTAQTHGLDAPTAALLSLQLIVMFFLAIGMRVSLAVPAALEANWVFQVSPVANAARLLAGVRRALLAGVLVPFLVCLIPLHAALWGARVAAWHFVAGLVASLLLVGALLAGCRKIPFTCPYVPGKANVKCVWPLYVLGFLAFTSGFAALEVEILQRPPGLVPLVVGGIFALVAIACLQRFAPSKHRALIFDEQPEPSIQTLGLD